MQLSEPPVLPRAQGHCYRSSTGKCERWYKPAWLEPGRLPSARADLGAIHDALVAAVVKRLMSDAPLGVLLSGGLDSSLVASIAVRRALTRPVHSAVYMRNAWSAWSGCQRARAGGYAMYIAPLAPGVTQAHSAAPCSVAGRLPLGQTGNKFVSAGLSARGTHERRHLKEARNAYDTEHGVHTFSIGIAGSPDLAAARRVAQFLGTQHHEFTFTVEEGIDAVYDLIYHIESFEQARPHLHFGASSSACVP